MEWEIEQAWLDHAGQGVHDDSLVRQAEEAACWAEREALRRCVGGWHCWCPECTTHRTGISVR